MIKKAMFRVKIDAIVFHNRINVKPDANALRPMGGGTEELIVGARPVVRSTAPQ